uniref:Cysteine-rich receptor-like protein kinase 10 n=1 Tax=Aegilops tauschii TaxID=37682 RepID=M8AZ93_AEGTA
MAILLGRKHTLQEVILRTGDKDHLCLKDTSKGVELDWNSRHNIIIGIARGLLYLHEDSLLKVIHRDLKPSNVLLDNKMNPKISDFGLARIFKDECNGVNTGRVVGTYGYMAPEFVMDSVFSVKSDVFGFGVLLLEILSGQRNGISYLEEHQQSLIQDAWKFWIEDRANEFIDRALGQSYSRDEAWRCFQVGLLCVQDDPDIRPTMSNVLLMLVSEQISMPAPSRPVQSLEGEWAVGLNTHLPTTLGSVFMNIILVVGLRKIFINAMRVSSRLDVLGVFRPTVLDGGVVMIHGREGDKSVYSSTFVKFILYLQC